MLTTRGTSDIDCLIKLDREATIDLLEYIGCNASLRACLAMQQPDAGGSSDSRAPHAAVSCGARAINLAPPPQAPDNKSLLLLFFRKEGLP
jgi:hypothetical protein